MFRILCDPKHVGVIFINQQMLSIDTVVDVKICIV